MKHSIEEIAALDGRYSVGVMYFVHEGLSHAVQKHNACDTGEKPRHITGQQLCRGLAEYAGSKWGRLAKVVLNYNGIKTTRDFGEVVYALISHGWMSAQEQDAITDFDDVYDFEDVFEKQFKFSN
ncbi:MAG: hypothetical protein K8R02_00590 [Anaerohalosphaeraceae bacterium]|nr:hypothetical protein [Anaerohalosphaeraceae bacterium]